MNPPDQLDYQQFKDYARAVDGLLASYGYFQELERRKDESGECDTQSSVVVLPQLSEPAPKKEYELL